MTMSYAGLWKPGAGAEGYFSASDAASFRDWQQKSFNQGFFVTDLDLESVGGTVVYSAVAHPGSGEQLIQGATSGSAFKQWNQGLFDKGLRLSSFSMCNHGDSILYAGVMHKGVGAQYYIDACDWTSFSNWAAGHLTGGLRLASLTTCVVNGEVMYGGVVQPSMFGGLVQPSSDQLIQPATDVRTFVQWATDIARKGYGIGYMSTCSTGSEVKYAGVAHLGNSGEFISAPLPWANFGELQKKEVAQGYRLVAFAPTDILPSSRAWQIAPFSCGEIDCNGASVVAGSDGTWSFYGSLHDESFWYGDNYALGFVFGNTSHGTAFTGALGAVLDGPPVDGTFNRSGKDPWIAKNWPTVYNSGVYYHMTVAGDPGQLFSGVLDFLKKYGSEIVSLVELL